MPPIVVQLVPPPEHAPHADHALHPQPPESQVRERVCIPQPHLPHACVSISVKPGEQTLVPPPLHAPQGDHAPHAQPSQARMRVCVPPQPQLWLSMST